MHLKFSKQISKQSARRSLPRNRYLHTGDVKKLKTGIANLHDNPAVRDLEETAMSGVARKKTFLLSITVMFLIWGLLGIKLLRLQVISTDEYTDDSRANYIEKVSDTPPRGAIFDRNGELIARNITSTTISLQLDKFFVQVSDDDTQRINETLSYVESAIKYTIELDKESAGNKDGTAESEKILDDIANSDMNEAEKLRKLYEVFGASTKFVQARGKPVPQMYVLDVGGILTSVRGVVELMEINGIDRPSKVDLTKGEQGLVRMITTAQQADTLVLYDDVDNEGAIVAKSHQSEILGLQVEDDTKRMYPYGSLMAHITGYIGPVFMQNDVQYADSQDLVGKLGLEYEYDKVLFGTKGVTLMEYDRFGQKVPSSRVLKEEVPGRSIVTSIDADMQKRLDAALEYGVDRYDASGGVAIVEDIHTGEILAMVSTPSYDPNDFIGGISPEKFREYLEDAKGLPLMNKPIAAQYPPGSTFKTVVAASALDADAATKDTVYVSSSGFRLSNGASFQEYHNHSYGRLNLIDAIKKSSNQYFCQLIIDWDMDELDKRLEKFGIGSPTGIDLPGEASGRLPSPENKIKYAQDPNVTWLDPIWYPEGDSCNSVIGQGITTVTPIQMVNWISAIANGGTLQRPHLAIGTADDLYWRYTRDTENHSTSSKSPDRAEGIRGEKYIDKFEFSPIRKDVVKPEALAVVREAMHRAVADSDGGIFGLRGANVDIAAKTGTAEFGRVNEDGSYEHAHGWVTGFYPYDDPQYAFVMLLEDAGESYYTVDTFRHFIDDYYK